MPPPSAIKVGRDGRGARLPICPTPTTAAGRGGLAGTAGRRGLLLPGNYQRERRELAERRKAAFAAESTGPNQVWRLEFSSSRPPPVGPGGWLAVGTLVQVRVPVPRFTHW